MTGWRHAGAALAVLAVVVLAGCASLPFGEPKPKTPAAVPLHTEYRLEVEAPDALRPLLANYLDIARFQNVPENDRVSDVELERLMRAAPAQARELLETEGYFNAVVTVPPITQDNGLPRVRLIVAPGPRTLVSAVALDANDELRGGPELEALQAQWPLRVGEPFRQAAWSAAKNATLTRLRGDGYAAATWRSTKARVDAPENRVEIELVIDSGPLFRIGAVRIEGLERYDEDAVRRLSNIGIGDRYTEKSLLDFQDRLQKVGLFEGASVELDANVEHAGAATVIVHVKEQTQQQATIGVGYSANTGPRVSLAHTNRRILGYPFVLHNKVELGPDQQTWQGDLTSYPQDNLYRNLLSGSAQRLHADDQTLLGWNARIGRTQDTPRIERLYFAEFAHTRIDSDDHVLTSQADALTYNYHWVYRDVDNVLLPTRGLTTSLQAALGYSRGSQSVLGEALQNERGPLGRLYARLTWYHPFGDAWYGTARVEAGQVFTHSVIGVPDSLLFRAGGDESVRGYAYRTLAPSVDGVTTSGRTLFTTSLEIARPISPRYPAYWWAAFIDAGNAADRFTDLKPAYGYGVGLRWRSPVGPLRIDLAYGQQTKQVRTHFSVGIAF
ncbi:MAG: BamA/TamA family outer membrane protein [Burkholderiales bacterium]